MVKALVARGDRVWGVARRGPMLKELKSQLPNGNFLYSGCDVTKEEDVDETLRMMKEKGFAPDVLVLNAGVNDHDLIPEYDHSRYRQVLETNLFGVMRWVDAFLPVFRKDGTGQFVAVSSISAFLTSSQGAGYSASKAALTSSFESLRKRYAKEGITFTTIHLGPVDTPMWQKGWFPFILSQEAVSRRILKAIDRREAVVDQPFFLSLAARMLRVIP